MFVMFGIPNCDTVKKAKKWLNDHDVEFTFHDYKKLSISEMLLKSWIEQVGVEKLVNKRGTTWRKLSQESQELVMNPQKSIPILIEHTSMIKRPIIVEGDRIVAVGFSESEWQTIFIH